MIIKDLIQYLKNVPSDIQSIEARHVVFCEAPMGMRNDYHLVKEVVTYKDGRVEPRTVVIENYERPFYVTKTGWQNHLEKKEWEKKEKLDRFTTTQSKLKHRIAQVLSTMQPNPRFPKWFDAPRSVNGGLRQMLRNPWIYGADIKSSTLIKRTYQQRFNHVTTPSTVSVFDIETDVVHGTEEIIMASLSYKKRIITAIDEKFMGTMPEPIRQLLAAFETYMAEDKEKRKIDWEVVIVNGPVEIVRRVFQRAHEWKPDFVAIWNINFDLPKVLLTLAKANVDPKDIFCDPLVPNKYRHFKYIEGKNKMITASGKVKPLKWVEQWHTAVCPASFYFVDQACAYKRIRTGAESDEPNYALDAIMKKHLEGRGKLKGIKGDHLSGLAWHKYMQTQYKIEYSIYNVFDCVGPELLDENTNDLRLTMPMMVGASDYHDFSSQPRCSADNLHFFVQTKGYVLGTTSDQMAHELDQYCVPVEGWICTLPAGNIAMNGLKLLYDYPSMVTRIYTHVGDLDVAASYPNGGAVFNMSKDTTVRELHRIDDVEFEDQREQGINLSGGHTNCVEFATVILKCPQPDTFLDAFLEDEGLPPIKIGPVAYPATVDTPPGAIRIVTAPIEEEIAA